MKRSSLFATAASTLALATAVAAPPNLVVIIADDLGYADVGFNGCKDIPTPNIDSIASQGVRFSSAYVTYSVCGPSRAGLMTGRYPQRFGFERNPQYRSGDPNMGVPLSERILADVLKEAGYTSGVVGKWHLGAHPTLHPLERGFDFFFGHLGGGHRYFPEELTIRESADAKDESESYRTWILRNREPIQIQKYLTDEFSDAAVEFIEASKDKPFFLYLSYNAPHTPLQATEEYLARFPGIENPKRRTYAAMVSAMDDGVGRVLAKLKELGLDDNTLVFFLSDNGGPTQTNASRNTPLRGNKGDVWEGGWRVPFALRWTGHVPAGASFDQPVSSLDIFATIAALAGVQPDPAKPLDGVNLVPFIHGREKAAPHRAIYLRKFDQQAYAVRMGDFKLVLPGKEKPAQLFNLEKDISEQRNVISGKPDIAEAIDKLRLEWDSQLIEPQFLGLTQTESWQKRKGGGE